MALWCGEAWHWCSLWRLSPHPPVFTPLCPCFHGHPPPPIPHALPFFVVQINFIFNSWLTTSYRLKFSAFSWLPSQLPLVYSSQMLVMEILGNSSIVSILRLISSCEGVLESNYVNLFSAAISDLP